jgi:hypothetical protein
MARAPRIEPGRWGRGVAHGCELLLGPLELAVLREPAAQLGAQLDEDLHVEGGVLQPVLRERPSRPVRSTMALGQGHAQDVLHHRAQSDPGHAQQAPGQLRVEQGGGGQAQLGQAGKVLAGGVKDPLRAAQRRGKAGDAGQGMRIDQRAAGPLTADLDQVGTLAVPVTGGALGVHRDRARACHEVVNDPVEVVLGLGDPRQPVAQLERGQGCGLLGLSLFGVGQGGGLGHGCHRTRAPPRPD